MTEDTIVEDEGLNNEVTGQEEELDEEQKAAKEAEDLEARKQRRQERNNRRLAQHAEKLAERNRKLEQDLAYERGQREAMQKTRHQVPAKPRLDEYDTQEEYLEALADYKLDERIRKLEDADDADGKPDAEDTEDIPTSTKIVDDEVFDSYLDKGEEQFGNDFNDMMEAAKNNEFEVSPFMAEVIFESDNGPAIAMYLYDNPKESAKIAKLNPARQMREILKLETNLKNGERRVSRAPRPPTPETKTGGNPRIVDLSKPMPTEDYIRQRRAQMESARRK